MDSPTKPRASEAGSKRPRHFSDDQHATRTRRAHSQSRSSFRHPGMAPAAEFGLTCWVAACFPATNINISTVPPPLYRSPDELNNSSVVSLLINFWNPCGFKIQLELAVTVYHTTMAPFRSLPNLIIFTLSLHHINFGTHA
jgi:hypothetical protein